MAIYAIGDIHGSINALKTIFQHGLIKEDDNVVFLGDYVDKGADSKGVINWLIEKSKTFDFEFILGNHELMMTRAKSSTEIFEHWLEYYGGSLTLNSYKIGDNQNWMNQIDKTHWNFIYYSIFTYGLCIALVGLYLGQFHLYTTLYSTLLLVHRAGNHACLFRPCTPRTKRST